MIIGLTGATGALGGVLRDVLRREGGHEVRGLSRNPPDGSDDGVQWVRGDLDDSRALDAFVAGTDAIVHAGYAPLEAPPPPGRSIAEHFAQTNLAGTVRLIERTPLTSRHRLVFVSSLAVYGPDPSQEAAARRGVPIDEDYPVRPPSFYGAHKAALEHLVLGASRDLGLHTTAFRVGCVLTSYADPSRDHLLPIVREAAQHCEIRTRTGAYVISAEDTARVIMATLEDETTRGQIYNTFDRWLDFGELAPALTDALERPVVRACAAAPKPQPSILNGKLRSRFAEFDTDATLDRLIRGILS